MPHIDHASPDDLLPIGAVAERSGLAVSALRFYETHDLIHSSRTDGGQRRGQTKVAKWQEDFWIEIIRASGSEEPDALDWSRLPEDLLARVATTIINKVKGVNRVVYDISSKPPATIEWE